MSVTHFLALPTNAENELQHDHSYALLSESTSRCNARYPLRQSNAEWTMDNGQWTMDNGQFNDGPILGKLFPVVFCVLI
jgi:hypothetical protein